jgi:hypothetical protein
MPPSPCASVGVLWDCFTIILILKCYLKSFFLTWNYSYVLELTYAWRCISVFPVSVAECAVCRGTLEVFVIDTVANCGPESHYVLACPKWLYGSHQLYLPLLGMLWSVMYGDVMSQAPRKVIFSQTFCSSRPAVYVLVRMCDSAPIPSGCYWLEKRFCSCYKTWT